MAFFFGGGALLRVRGVGMCVISYYYCVFVFMFFFGLVYLRVLYNSCNAAVPSGGKTFWQEETWPFSVIFVCIPCASIQVDPRLVSDILEIAGNSIGMPLDLSVAAPAMEKTATGAAAMELEEPDSSEGALGVGPASTMDPAAAPEKVCVCVCVLCLWKGRGCA